MPTPKDLRIKVEMLQDILLARATGDFASPIKYQNLRTELLDLPEIAGDLPKFIQTNRTLEKFWAFIQRKFSTYQERRQFIWVSFAPLLARLETESKSLRSKSASKKFERTDNVLGESVPVSSPLNESSSKIFVVHGRNLYVRDSMFNFLRAAGLDPIEWSEARSMTGESAPYIGRILETAFSAARAVVVLLTPDDDVRLREELWSDRESSDEKEVRRQARPNVLFEAGMAFGSHPRRTLLVQVGDVKAFSDIAGRHIVHLTNAAESRMELLRRLEDAGCKIAWSRNDWMRAGDFALSYSAPRKPR